MNRPTKAIEIYEGSDGDATRAYYAELARRGPIGDICVCIFRAQKCSARAKVYRGGIRGQGSFRSMAYDRKNWSLENLCKALEQHAAALGIRYGWKRDPAAEYHTWVLYVDLPDAIGQVSFHADKRGLGPDYSGDWDRVHKSAERILAFCDAVMQAPDPRQKEMFHAD